MLQHSLFNLRADDPSHLQAKAFSIRQRSLYIVHIEGDAWFHFSLMAPPTRMKDKKLLIADYTQHDVSLRA